MRKAWIGFVASLLVVVGAACVPQTPPPSLDITISPAGEGFGFAPANSGSVPATFVVTNPNTTPTGVIDDVVFGAEASDFHVDHDGCDGEVLAGGATCTIDLSFRPTFAGPRNGVLAVTASPGGYTFATLRGDGVIDGPALAMSPSHIDFAPTAVGSSRSVTVTVTNYGEQPTDVMGWAVQGEAFGYGVPSDTCYGSPLAAHASCSITLDYAPTLPGTSYGELIVGDPSVQANAWLSGSATTAVPGLTVSPSPGDVPLDGTTIFAITNNGTGPIDFGGISMTNYNSNFISFGVTGSCGAGMAPGETCYLTLYYGGSSGGPGYATAVAEAGPDSVTFGVKGLP